MAGAAPLALVEEAHAKNERYLHDSERAQVTRMFARYEEGLVLLELREWGRAVHVLELCADAQKRDHDWPRLGALAALVRGYLGNGRGDLAERALDACVAVARDERVPGRLRRAAAVGDSSAVPATTARRAPAAGAARLRPAAPARTASSRAAATPRPPATAVAAEPV